jgi:SagB-type dehydrogenase family enzyme
MQLDKAILSRVSVRDIMPCPIRLKDLTALLHLSYGITRDAAASGLLRGFRVVPSAGGLYPLEIFFHSAHVEGLAPGLYHYNPSKHHLRFLREGDHRHQIAQSLIQGSIAQNASLLIFMTALFERSIFKYGNRGYRFALLEAGHVAQNINLVSSALGLGCLNIGGFVDRDIDEFLQIDGITHSTIYMLAVGMRPQRRLPRVPRQQRED